MASQHYEVGSAGYAGFTLCLDVYSTASDAQSNYSSISWNVYIRKANSSSYSYNYKTHNVLKIMINGSTLVDKANWGTIDISGQPAGWTKVLEQGSFNISHNVNGDCSFNVYESMKLFL